MFLKSHVKELSILETFLITFSFLWYNISIVERFEQMTEVKKELTKDLLALSFKELIMKMPFEKITVKMITEGADVIRPTFYKHFQDKYEILEYILRKRNQR